MILNYSRAWLHGIFIFCLLLAALWFPLPLYLGALAIFGLPHVLWEKALIRSRYAARWPLRWWLGLGVVLLLQAGIRTAVWMGKYPAESSQIVDLLTLFLLASLLVLAIIHNFTPLALAWDMVLNHICDDLIRLHRH